MGTITPRQVLTIDTDVLWSELRENKLNRWFRDINPDTNQVHKRIDITFADSVVRLTWKELFFNRICWELFNLCPGIEINSRHSVHQFTRDSHYTKRTHTEVLQVMFGDICEYLSLETAEEKEPYLEMIYRVTNRIYNEMVVRISDHVTSIDAVDFIEVVDDPDIVQIHSEMEETPEGIEKTYAKIFDYLDKNKKSPNRFIQASVSGGVAKHKIAQCIGPRGVISDMDGSIHLKPAMGGFIRGLNDIYSLAIESRSAAKSLMVQNRDIRDTEYKSRSLQLLTMVVEKIVPGDCGNTDYVAFPVGEKDLPNIVGKYYFDSARGVLDFVRKGDTHLIGTNINMRLSTHCKLENPAHICSKCFGRLSGNIFQTDNIGQTVAAFLYSKFTQGNLSLKHLTASVTSQSEELPTETRQYFRSDRDDKIYLKPVVNDSKPKLLLPSSDLRKLVDLTNTQGGKILPTSIGEFQTAGLIFTSNGKELKTLLTVASPDRQCVLSMEFINYVRDRTLAVYSRDYFMIDMDEWDPKNPLFQVPPRERNVSMFAGEVCRIIQGTANKKDPFNIADPDEKLIYLYKYITKRQPTNLALLEIFIYATTCYDPDNGDYRLGRNSPTAKIAPASLIDENRSVAQLFAHEKGTGPLFRGTGSMFLDKKRTAHPFDALFDPDAIE